MSVALPEGRAGQVTAVGFALLALAAVWLGALAPALGWYQARTGALRAEQLQAAHMLALARSLPALRATAAAFAQSADATALLPGGSDEIAGANLQSTLQALAAQSGTSLDSATMLPAASVGALRQIGVSVSITATLPALVGLLAAIDAARPRCVVDDLTISGNGQPDPRDEMGQDISLQANFTVFAFRAGGGADGAAVGGS